MLFVEIMDKELSKYDIEDINNVRGTQLMNMESNNILSLGEKGHVAFCTGFNLLTPIFLLPYIIMDLPIFVIAEWATLLVDIRFPRGGS